MAVKEKKSTKKSGLSNEELLKILMQEIADVYGDLSKKIAGVQTELKGEIDNKHDSLKTGVEDVRNEIRAFRMKSHQNQVAFISNIQDHEPRITTLERQ